MRGRSALLMPALLVVLGVAIIARTVAAGGGPLAFGLLMGVLFVVAGVLRVVLERRR